MLLIISLFLLHPEPSAPTNLVLLERTNVSLYIMWDTPDSDGGSPITAYRVQTQNLRSFIIINREIGVVNTYNITDLTPFTIYSIRVAAFNDIGRGEQAIIENETLSESTSNMFHLFVLFTCNDSYTQDLKLSSTRLLEELPQPSTSDGGYVTHTGSWNIN